jgi:Fe-S cluster biogenesis protein NfuA
MLRRCVLRRCFGMPVPALETPNPDCLQYRVEDDIFPTDVTCDVPMRSLSHVHPLSAMIFDQYEAEVRSVFLARHYVTVTKWSDIRWSGVLERGIGGLIGQYVFLNEPIAPRFDGAVTSVHTDVTIVEGDSEVVQCIKELLKTEIKPMVQRDGGDVRFLGFDDGIVKLEMLGACKTCPSSKNTLKDGIERMMRHFIEEVKEVVEVRAKNTGSLAEEIRRSVDAERNLGTAGTVSGGRRLGNYEFTPNPDSARSPLEREAAIHMEEATKGMERDNDRIRSIHRQQQQRARLGRRVMSLQEMMEPEA